ncbi:MAG: hypothetical protein FJ271_11380 [Planctomycetes bacterium]|nr:hypothetical protein [Planctomycetota bacterium]
MYRAIVICLAAVSADVAAGEKKRAAPAWPGVFPEIAGYAPTFRAPVLVNDKQGVYSQSVLYDWTGGRLEAIEVTLARDAAFALAFSADRLKQQKPPPDAIKIGNHSGWLWKGKLVVIVAKDRILRLESKTEKFFHSNLPEFARRFDLVRCARALDRPPIARDSEAEKTP